MKISPNSIRIALQCGGDLVDAVILDVVVETGGRLDWRRLVEDMPILGLRSRGAVQKRVQAMQARGLVRRKVGRQGALYLDIIGAPLTEQERKALQKPKQKPQPQPTVVLPMVEQQEQQAEEPTPPVTYIGIPSVYWAEWYALRPTDWQGKVAEFLSQEHIVEAACRLRKTAAGENVSYEDMRRLVAYFAATVMHKTVSLTRTQFTANGVLLECEQRVHFMNWLRYNGMNVISNNGAAKKPHYTNNNAL